MPKVDEFCDIAGFARILILPPKQAYLWLEPKLMGNYFNWSLHEMSELIVPTDSCNYSDKQRTIKGTYPCCEIAKALDLETFNVQSSSGKFQNKNSELETKSLARVDIHWFIYR